MLTLGAVAARWINSAYASTPDLAGFDQTTRDNFTSALDRLKRLFVRRAVAGVALSFLAGSCGVLLAEADTLPQGSRYILAGLGGAALFAAAWTAAGLLRAALMPAEHLAALRKIAQQEKSARERLLAYDGHQ